MATQPKPTSPQARPEDALAAWTVLLGLSIVGLPASLALGLGLFLSSKGRHVAAARAFLAAEVILRIFLAAIVAGIWLWLNNNLYADLPSPNVRGRAQVKGILFLIALAIGLPMWVSFKAGNAAMDARKRSFASNGTSAKGLLPSLVIASLAGAVAIGAIASALPDWIVFGPQPVRDVGVPVDDSGSFALSRIPGGILFGDGLSVTGDPDKPALSKAGIEAVCARIEHMRRGGMTFLQARAYTAEELRRHPVLSSGQKVEAVLAKALPSSDPVGKPLSADKLTCGGAPVLSDEAIKAKAAARTAPVLLTKLPAAALFDPSTTKVDLKLSIIGIQAVCARYEYYRRLGRDGTRARTLVYHELSDRSEISDRMAFVLVDQALPRFDKQGSPVRIEERRCGLAGTDATAKAKP